MWPHHLAYRAALAEREIAVLHVLLGWKVTNSELTLTSVHMGLGSGRNILERNPQTADLRLLRSSNVSYIHPNKLGCSQTYILLRLMI